MIIPGTTERATAMFKDAKLRLLMTLCGFERLGIDDEPGATWVIPSQITARELHETHDCIERHRRDPVMQYGEDDPISAEDLLRRQTRPRAQRAEYDDDSEGGGIIDDGEEEFMFPAGGPVDKVRKKDALAELKKKRRKRHAVASSDDESEGLDDAAREARRKARLEADLEKRRKIKSAELVGDSDDDSEADAEFFRKEEQRRRGQAGKVMEALIAGRVNKGEDKSKRGGKRKPDGPVASTAPKRRKTSNALPDEDEEELEATSVNASSPPTMEASAMSSEDEESDTPVSSPHIGSSQSKAGDIPTRPRGSSQEAIGRKVEAFNLGERDGNESTDVEAEELIPSRPKPRRAVVLDDSDEDDF